MSVFDLQISRDLTYETLTRATWKKGALLISIQILLDKILRGFGFLKPFNKGGLNLEGFLFKNECQLAVLT